VRSDTKLRPNPSWRTTANAAIASATVAPATHPTFPRAAAHVSGHATLWDKAAESGNIVSRAFCPTCGSPVYSTNKGIPELLFVRAASLDDPDRYKPQMVVWSKSCYAWDHTDPALPKFEKMPQM
jgi:hypothetical protein